MAKKSLLPHTRLKFVLSLGLIFGSVIYAFTQNGFFADDDRVRTVSANTSLIQTPQSVEVASTPPQPTTTTAPVQTPVITKPKGLYADGSYTGSVADAYYGLVQVRATISGGKLTDVQFLQYPNDRSTSREINSQAMPLLKQEAIAAQSARVDGVSGATDTSAAFVESLGVALGKAKNG